MAERERVGDRVRNGINQLWLPKLWSVLAGMNKHLGAIAKNFEVLARIDSIDRRLSSIEETQAVLVTAVQRIIRMEVKQMAFAQDVLDRITKQTTLIGSIKVWIQNLPTDVVSAEEKAAILANLDANEAELSTAIPANVPPVA